MTVFCPHCARTLIADAAPRVRRQAVECATGCGRLFEVSTWPELPGTMAAQATLHDITQPPEGAPSYV